VRSHVDVFERLGALGKRRAELAIVLTAIYEQQMSVWSVDRSTRGVLTGSTPTNSVR
jgi:hypothetical protein